MANQTKQAPKLVNKVAEELSKLTTVSARIRYLDEQGLPRGDIARVLGKRYQHVKNVLDKPLKRD